MTSSSSHTYQDFLMKTPLTCGFSIFMKSSWWKPTDVAAKPTDENPQLDNSTFTLWKIWTFVFPPVFYHGPRCKEKGDLKGTKTKCSKKPLLNLFKWHRDGCFQKDKHIQNKEDLRWMGYSRYSRTQSVNIGEATTWKHFNPKSGLVGHNVGMLRAILTLKQGIKSLTYATSSTKYLEKFHSQLRV